MAGRWDTVKVDSADMRCYVTAPEGSGSSSAAVVIQHAGCVDQFIQTMTDRLTEVRYVGSASGSTAEATRRALKPRTRARYRAR